MMHPCAEHLAEGFLERGIAIHYPELHPYLIREITTTKGGNPKVGRRTLIITFCPTCGERLLPDG